MFKKYAVNQYCCSTLQRNTNELTSPMVIRKALIDYNSMSNTQYFRYIE